MRCVRGLRSAPVFRPMPPAAVVNCLTCADFYPGKAVKPGKLGEAPNKYCYRAKCHEEGMRRGHIKTNKRAASPAGGGGHSEQRCSSSGLRGRRMQTFSRYHVES